MANSLGNNRFEGDFGMPMLPGEELSYQSGDFVRITALELCSREIARRKVQGAAAELGVYKGAFAKYINLFFPDRRLYLFDTFEGFHPEDVSAGRELGLSEQQRDFSDAAPEAVLSLLSRPQNAVIQKGRFPVSAKGVEDEFCFVSLDADLYAPTRSGLQFFWPRLSPGGFIFLHDYNNVEYPGVAAALREFSAKFNISFTCLPDICGTAVITK